MASIQAQISEVEREISMRVNVYRGFVHTRKMKQEEADIRIANMRAVLKTLEQVRDKGVKE